MPSDAFPLDAWVIGGRHRHHRTRDHFGADSDLYITIDEQIGPWGAGTPVKYVIDDLYQRISILTSANHVIRVLHLDAVVLTPASSSAPVVPGAGLGIKRLDALVFKHMSSSFTLNAFAGKGSHFTVDGYVPARGVFYLNAFVV